MNLYRNFNDDGLGLYDSYQDDLKLYGDNDYLDDMRKLKLESGMLPGYAVAQRDFGYGSAVTNNDNAATFIDIPGRGAIDDDHDLAKSNFLRAEKSDYLNDDLNSYNLKEARDEIDEKRLRAQQSSFGLNGGMRSGRGAGLRKMSNFQQSSSTDAPIGPWPPEQFFSRADQLAKAAEWARSRGDIAASDAYQKEANSIWYAGNAEKLRLFNRKADALFADRNSKVPANPFYPGWNTGDYSAGFEQPGIPRPNYVTASGGGFGLGGSGTVNLDSGHTYTGAAGNVPVTPGGSLVWGYILGNTSADDLKKRVDATNQFLDGSSFQIGGSLFGIYGGINHAFGGPTAIELGFGTPGFSKSAKPGVSGGVGISRPTGRLSNIGRYQE